MNESSSENPRFSTFIDPIPDHYKSLWNEHNRRPVPASLWDRVIDLAQQEESTGRSAADAYRDIPLTALLELSNNVRQAQTPRERYALMAQQAPNGALWFDTLLGLSTPEVTHAIKKYISNQRWPLGLDLGTGTGVVARAITKHCGSVVALDTSRDLLKIALQRREQVRGGRYKMLPVEANAFRLPLGNHTVDLAVSSGLTSWLPRPHLERFVQELARVIEPNGFYVSAFPVQPGENKLHPSERRSLGSAKGILADMIVDVVNGSHQMRPEQISSLRTYKQIFKANNFDFQIEPFPQYGAVVMNCMRLLDPQQGNVIRFGQGASR